MAIKMVREPSDTPNINNIDDIVPMRYAYGGQNGFVIGKGTEISNTVNGLNFTVNSGRLVLQGVECDIDATGVTITIDNIATKRYYTVYLEVNLGLNTATIKDKYDTATYPTIDAGDDLTENTTGIARLPLYQFTATSGIIGEINKVVESVKYINSSITVNNSKQVNNLEIKQDENGVLKIGDIIIPQKQLLWSPASGDYAVSTTSITLNSPISKGDVIEIAFVVGYTSQYDIVPISKFRVGRNSIEIINNIGWSVSDSLIVNTIRIGISGYKDGAYSQITFSNSTEATIGSSSRSTAYYVFSVYKIIE